MQKECEKFGKLDLKRFIERAAKVAEASVDAESEVSSVEFDVSAINSKFEILQLEKDEEITMKNSAGKDINLGWYLDVIEPVPRQQIQKEKPESRSTSVSRFFVEEKAALRKRKEELLAQEGIVAPNVTPNYEVGLFVFKKVCCE